MARAEFLLVDGYNMIYAWDDLKMSLEVSLDAARKRLLDILSDFQGSTGKNIIVVFDAHKVSRATTTIEEYHNIKVVYTKEAETADNYIEKTTNKLVKNYKVLVATNDYLEQMIILGYGATRISAKELREEVKAKKKQLKYDYIDKRPIKNNMLLDNLDPETAMILEQMRRGKN